MARRKRPVLLMLYLALAQCLGPFFYLLHKRRLRAGKDDPARGREKFGISDRIRPAGSLVWIHAASVGESNSILPLVDHFIATGSNVLVTTVTRTAAEMLESRLPQGALHQYAPFDRPEYIYRFLMHWRPQLAVFVESEVWPATFDRISRQQIPFALVNARLSEKSYRSWRRVGSLARYLFTCPSLVMAQSEADRERLQALGAKEATCPGNLKFEVEPGKPQAEALHTLQRQIGTRPVWLAALTHPGEDEIALAAHEALAKRFPDLLLVLVPRHPERAEAVARLAGERGFEVVRHSTGTPIGRGTSIFIGDTIGNMSLYYSLTQTVFLGGSFADVGGHNPVEPAAFGAALVTGPKVANARVTYAALWQAQAAVRVETQAALIDVLGQLLAKPEHREEMSRRARKVVLDARGALAKTTAALAALRGTAEKPAVSGEQVEANDP